MIIRESQGKTNSKKEMILELALNSNLPQSEIARMAKCSRCNVAQILKRYGIKSKKVEEYKSARSEIIAGYEMKILDHITDSKLKNATLSHLTTSMKTLYEIERLETNKSTSNVAVNAQLPESLQAVIDRIGS
jgi:hypothetical protein